MNEIQELIPHRPPFLFVDEIVECTGDRIVTRRTVPKDEFWVQGHYPDYPIMPGVLLCEAVFQTGALLMVKRDTGTDGKVPVLSRVQGVKLKHAVYPGDVIDMTVDFKEQVGPAFYLKGRVEAGGRTALTVEFTVTVMERER